MVIDSSALLAILQNEPESQLFTDAVLSAEVRLIASPTLFEAPTVMLSRLGEEGLADLEAFCRGAYVETVPFTTDHAMHALDAFRRYGKGRHRAALNLGDCFSYALAKATGEPLLFKGNDFPHTDIKRAAIGN